MSSKYWNDRVDHYVLDGVPYMNAWTPLGRVTAVTEYADIREDDVIVAGFPKTGNHLVMDIVRKIRNKGDISKSIKETCDVSLENYVPEFAQYNREVSTPLSLDEISALKSPRVMNTHLYFEKIPRKAQAGHCKIIHVLRDPRDAACSWHNMETRAQQELVKYDALRYKIVDNSFQDFVKEFINGTVPFGSWYDHTKSYLNAENALHILHVKYEDILNNMEEEIKRISIFIGEDLRDDTISKIAESCQIENAKKAFPASIFLNEGKVGGWKDRFTVAQNETLKEKMLEKLNGYHKEIQTYLI